MLGTILLVLLILMLVGAFPAWPHSKNWGYFPSGGLGLLAAILLILILLGRIKPMVNPPPNHIPIMFQSIKKLYGQKLNATDGEIGQVKDFYFDDHCWAVRYMVVETGTWLTGRQVLLSPLALGYLCHDGRDVLVNLTKKQIEDSPPIEKHKPVSRQYEEEYHRYYGWPYYWEGDGLWGGMRGLPVLEVPPDFLPVGQPADSIPKPGGPDAHLRSAQAVNGYHLQATDGIVGHVCDFLMDDKSWAIAELVIKFGHRFSGKEVRIPAGRVTRISYDESKVYVNLNTEAVEHSPAHDLVPVRVNGFTPPGENPFKTTIPEVLAP